MTPEQRQTIRDEIVYAREHKCETVPVPTEVAAIFVNGPAGRFKTVTGLTLHHEVERLRATLATYQNNFRDRAALAALTGILANPERMLCTPEHAAADAYRAADAMLHVRGAPGEGS